MEPLAGALLLPAPAPGPRLSQLDTVPNLRTADGASEPAPPLMAERGARPGWVDDLDVLDAIEASLTPEQHAGLHQLIQTLHIEPDAWLQVPSLRQTYGLAAALNVVRQFEAEGCTEERAWGETEVRLKIPSKTLETWRRRWRKYAA